eukprot:COSAG06_NODE_2548_length_6692_cov_35.291066_3_plen_212_part_00
MFRFVSWVKASRSCGTRQARLTLSTRIISRSPPSLTGTGTRRETALTVSRPFFFTSPTLIWVVRRCSRRHTSLMAGRRVACPHSQMTVRLKHPLSEPFRTENDSFCQDRLGTNIWKTLRFKDRFVQALRLTSPLATGKKTGFLRHLYIKMMILPRQARDKHRERTQKSPFSRREGSWEVRTETSFLRCHLMILNYRTFAKTGSGQTHNRER